MKPSFKDFPRFEEGDFLRLRADTDSACTFETIVAKFLPDREGYLSLKGRGEQKLNSMFLGDDEEITFDSLRATGIPAAKSR